MKTGFTIIELLVAISIIAILSAIGLTQYNKALISSRDALRKRDIGQLGSALEIYYQKNGHYVQISGVTEANCQDAVPTFYVEIAPYMSGGNVPRDPKTDEGYCYIPENEGASYRLFAKLEDCTDKDIIPTISENCADALFNYSKVSEDLFIAAAPEDVGLEPSPTPTPPPPTTPPPSSPPPSSPPPTSPSQAACADGTSDQTYADPTMVGCNGSVRWVNAQTLCASGSTVCSLNQYIARGGKTTAPTTFRWLSTPSRGVSVCSSNLCGSTSCDIVLDSAGGSTENPVTADPSLKRAYLSCPLTTNDLIYMTVFDKSSSLGTTCCLP